jgi:hypothetical protein
METFAELLHMLSLEMHVEHSATTLYIIITNVVTLTKKVVDVK